MIVLLFAYSRPQSFYSSFRRVGRNGTFRKINDKNTLLLRNPQFYFCGHECAYGPNISLLAKKHKKAA